MSELILTLLVNATCALLAIWLYTHALKWVQFRFSGLTRTTFGLALFFLIAVLIVLSLGYVLNGASSGETPWWVAIVAWVISILPAALFWAKRGKSIRI